MSNKTAGSEIKLDLEIDSKFFMILGYLSVATFFEQIKRALYASPPFFISKTF